MTTQTTSMVTSRQVSQSWESASATESTPLLRETARTVVREVDDKIDQVKTTWQQEIRVIILSALPLLVTYSFQYLISISGIFAVGRIGALELGAASLAVMTGNVTCNLLIQGLATGLDTLCPQAYGSGQKHLVGIQLQRMIFFILPSIVPIMIAWWHSEYIFIRIIPNPETARLAGLYLQWAILGAPGFAMFECGKRFVQAQGLFHVTTYVILLAAPFNVLMMWLLIWKLEFGFIGAPIAVSLTNNFMALMLFLYVWLIDGSECWGGITKKAFTNWRPMLRLAVPSMMMLVTEFSAAEILTLASSHFGTNQLAAESCLMTIATSLYFIIFPVSVAASTRVANLIGAGSATAAKISAMTAVAIVLVFAAPVVIAVAVGRHQIPYLFTNDAEVARLTAVVMPILAAEYVFDALAGLSGGLLRGIGWPEFGGIATVIVYYAMGLPVSFGTGFGLDWELQGFWAGIALGMFTLTIVEFWWIWRSNWEDAVDAAAARNRAG